MAESKLKQTSDFDLDKAFTTAVQDGRGLHAQVQTFQIQAHLLNEFYDIGHGDLRRKPGNVSDELKRWNIQLERIQFLDVYPPGQADHGDYIYSHHMSGAAGLLLVNDVYKDRDINEKNKRMRPSEVGWQAWIASVIRDNSRPTGLRALAVSTIVNPNTRDVIFESCRRSTFAVSRPYGHVEFTPANPGFYAILGSLLGKIMMNMLLDHKAEIGFRVPVRIVVLGRKDLELGREWYQARTILVLLSAPRSRPRSLSVPPRPPQPRLQGPGWLNTIPE